MSRQSYHISINTDDCGKMVVEHAITKMCRRVYNVNVNYLRNRKTCLCRPNVVGHTRNIEVQCNKLGNACTRITKKHSIKFQEIYVWKSCFQ